MVLQKAAMTEIDPRQVKIHWTHKARIKTLYKDGFSIEELALMYRLPYWYIKGLSRGVKRMERV
jgi:hypothetical protein